MLLIPIAFQVAFGVMFLEWVSRLSWNNLSAQVLRAFWLQLLMLATYSMGTSSSNSSIRLEHFLPPTEVFETLTRIDLDRPKSLIYPFAICLAISIFCLATLIVHVFTMLAKACISIPFVTCCSL